MTIWEKLAVPFLPSQLRWRIGRKSKDKKKATALAYVSARDVMERLDAVCEVDGWKDEYTTEPPRTIRKKDYKTKETWNEQICGRVICKLSIKNKDGEWITKCDGAGETTVEGEKGGISDAFKRAAVKFGVNRECYNLGTQWCTIDNYGNFTQTPKVTDQYQNKIEKYIAKSKAEKENK